MGRWWDARETPEGWRFRQWSSVTDSYVTDALTEDEAREEMMRERTVLEIESGIAATYTDQRIARAKVGGTTALGGSYKQDIHGPWEEERDEWKEG